MDNRRRNYFIDKGFQTQFMISFCFIVIVATLVVSLLAVILTRGSTTVVIENTRVFAKGTSAFLRPLMIRVFVLVTIFSSLAVIILTLFVSHRIAGPLFSINRQVQKLIEGDLTVRFHLRTNDQIQTLAVALEQLVRTWQERWGDMRQTVHTMDKLLESSQPNIDQLREVAKELRQKTETIQS